MDTAAVDLPVLWWVSWLVVMGIGVFGGFIWWLTTEALEMDRASRELHDRERSEATVGERDAAGPARP